MEYHRRPSIDCGELTSLRWLGQFGLCAAFGKDWVYFARVGTVRTYVGREAHGKARWAMGDSSTSNDVQAIDRRKFLRRAGTVAWAAPLIVSMTVNPANAQTATCVPGGRPCTPNGLPCCKRNHKCRPTGAGFKCVGPGGQP